jgi:hypothetical protein
MREGEKSKRNEGETENRSKQRTNPDIVARNPILKEEEAKNRIIGESEVTGRRKQGEKSGRRNLRQRSVKVQLIIFIRDEVLIVANRSRAAEEVPLVRTWKM